MLKMSVKDMVSARLYIVDKIMFWKCQQKTTEIQRNWKIIQSIILG